MEQFEHDGLAAALAAERQYVDRPADGPDHVVGEIARKRLHIVVRQGLVEAFDNGARNRLGHG